MVIERIENHIGLGALRLKGIRIEEVDKIARDDGLREIDKTGLMLFERVGFLLHMRRKTFRELQKACGITRLHFEHWPAGRLPNAVSLALMAMELRVTCDYLLGYTELPEEQYLATEKFTAEDIRFSFLCRFEDLLEEQKLTEKAMWKYFGIRGASFYCWKNGNNMPRLRSIQRIADFYGLSVDYLLGLTETKYRKGCEGFI